MKDDKTADTIRKKIEKLISELRIDNCNTILSILEIQEVYIHQIVILFFILYRNWIKLLKVSLIQ